LYRPSTGGISSGIVAILRTKRTRQAKDKMWEVNHAQLKFSEPSKVIGKGSFGVVLLGEYRGTHVAAKTLRNHYSPPSRTSSMEFAPDDVESVDGQVDKCPTSEVRSVTHSRGSSSGLFEKRQKASMNDFVKAIRYCRNCDTRALQLSWAVKDKKNPMVVMEYMAQGSLYNLIHNQLMGFEGEILLSLLQDISKGILFLHKTKPQVIHGDLKSHNILVDSRFRTKVTDFGLSFGHDADSSIRTPYCSAPEVLRG
jgi:serine/threonine protein kinase